MTNDNLPIIDSYGKLIVTLKWISVNDHLPAIDEKTGKGPVTLLYSKEWNNKKYDVSEFTLCDFDDETEYWWYDHELEGKLAPTHWAEIFPPNEDNE